MMWNFLLVTFFVFQCVHRVVGEHGLVVSDEERLALLRELGLHTTTLPTTKPPVLLETMKPKMFKDNKQDVHYCEYKGVKFAPGTDFKDMDGCAMVRCSEQEFRIQRQPKVKYTPGDEKTKKCKWIVAGCRRFWVLAKKPRKTCHLIE